MGHSESGVVDPYHQRRGLVASRSARGHRSRHAVHAGCCVNADRSRAGHGNRRRGPLAYELVLTNATADDIIGLQPTDVLPYVPAPDPKRRQNQMPLDRNVVSFSC